MTDIKGVVIESVCRETDANPFSVKLIAKSGGTTDVGPAQPIGSSTYVYRQRVIELNPDTGLPWTSAEVNAAQFGFEAQ